MATTTTLRASVAQLLVGAYTLPCSAAAQAFAQLVQPSARFQLALDALLPLLSAAPAAQRILAAFILHALYAPHPIALNPFRSALYAAFVAERARAIADGAASDNEQLVWVLWKILKGDGNDIAPYSPSTLTRSPLLPELRASNLVLDEGAFADAKTPEPTPAPAAPEDDESKERIARAMKLLLAARDRALTLAEQRILTPAIPSLTAPPMITSMDLPPIVAHNPHLAYQLLLALLSAAVAAPLPYLDALTTLPPTLPSFDLLARLLQDPTIVVDPATRGKTTIADMVRVDVLGRFIHESIKWLDKAEKEEREGLLSDDRFAKGVQNLCRFYTSLIRLSIVDVNSDADTAEMAHFTLRQSRFEEANSLYRILVAGRF